MSYFSDMSNHVVRPFIPSIDYEALGKRLRAYRLGAALLAEDIAEQLGVSRAAVYRMEKGEIVKIETVERLAQLLNVSVASLLGVEVEYYVNAISFFERMRQLEQDSERIMAHFSPVSLLLTSDSYLTYLRTMLLESLPASVANAQESSGVQRAALTEIEDLLDILAQRKTVFQRRQPNIISLVGLRDLEHFIRTGLVGRLGLPDALRAERIAAARAEVLRIAEVMESEPMNIQVGLIDDAMPNSTFQIFVGAASSVLAVSSFRFGELPNIRNGVASVTSSTEAVRHYEAMIERLWKHAYKGRLGAQRLRKLLDDV